MRRIIRTEVCVCVTLRASQTTRPHRVRIATVPPLVAVRPPVASIRRTSSLSGYTELQQHDCGNNLVRLIRTVYARAISSSTVDPK